MAVRRLVTGINVHGKSEVVHDGPTPGRIDLMRAVLEELWSTDSTPPDLTGSGDPADVQRTVLQPQPGGVVWRCVTYPPRSVVAALDAASEEFRRAHEKLDDGGAMEPENPGWHTTNTLDFGIVVSGEIILELDDGPHHLKAGDCVVQRGTRHAWRNPGNEPCVISFVLISGEPQ